MREVAVLVMLVSACRFAPTGGTGATADAAGTDAAEADGGAVDAQALDAAPIDAAPIDAVVIDAPAIDAAVDAIVIDGLPRDGGGACYTSDPGPLHLPPLARVTFAGANLAVSGDRTDSFLQAETEVAFATDGVPVIAYIAVTQTGPFIATTRLEATPIHGSIRAPAGSNAASDPTVASTPGAVHVGFVTYSLVGGQASNLHVRVATSRDGGATFAAPVQLDAAGTCADACDKPWLVAGPNPGSPTGRSLYLSFMAEPTAASSQLLLARSDDDGATWTPPRVIFSGGAEFANLAMPYVDADGTVHLVWLQGPDTAHLTVRWTRSPAGGESFAPSIVVNRAGERIAFDDPTIAAHGGVIHVGYVVGNFAPGVPMPGPTTLVLATKVGAAAFVHRNVGDEPDACAHHDFYAIAADPARSQVHFLWLEDRFGPGAAAYARCPDDPAQPCGTNELVSDADFTFTTNRNSVTWLGDYNGLAISGHDLIAAWTDNRSGRAAIYAARATLP